VYVKGKIVVCTWVDDIIMFCPRGDKSSSKVFDADLRKEFEVSPWVSGEAGWILNMKIVRDWDSGTLHLSQEAAIDKLVGRFGSGKAPLTPMLAGQYFTKPGEDDIVPVGDFDYMSAVGGLLYISLTTRPDIAYSVGVLSRYMAYPGREQVDAAIRIVDYLGATKRYGIRFSRSRHGESAGAPHYGDEPHAYLHLRTPEAVAQSDKEVVTYCDADLAGDKDTLKSTTGYCIVLFGGVISWMSKLQTTVALSTSEAETNAAVEAVKQIMFLRLFLREVGLTQYNPTVVHEDNAAALSFSQNSGNSKKTKHYQMKVHFLREQVDLGAFEMAKVTTVDQLADTFTKALPKDAFVRYRNWMGVVVREEPEAAAGLQSSDGNVSDVEAL
jgi:hypothetical protein